MEKIYQKLREEGITPNGLYVLWSIREGLAPSMVNASVEMRLLGQDWLDGNTLTGRSTSLLMEIDENFKDKKAKNEKELMGVDFKEKIEQFRLLFPDVKLPSGKYAREASKNLEVNFKWFFKTHEYDWNTILKATEKYVEEYRDKDWNYMRTSKYFVKKQEKDGSITSDLAGYCDMIVTGSGRTDEDNYQFPEKVF